MQYILNRLLVFDNVVEVIDVQEIGNDNDTDDNDYKQDAYLQVYDSLIKDIDKLNENNEYEISYINKNRTEVYKRHFGWTSSYKSLVYVYIINLYTESYE